MSNDVSQKSPRVSPSIRAATAPTGKAFSLRGMGITAVCVAVIGGFLLLWEIAWGRWLEPFLISSPIRIVSSLVTGFREGDLIQHTWVTFQEIAIGFPIGALSGIALGYAFGRSRLLAEIFEEGLRAFGLPLAARRSVGRALLLAGSRSLLVPAKEPELRSVRSPSSSGEALVLKSLLESSRLRAFSPRMQMAPSR